jgi:hypothetical protein
VAPNCPVLISLPDPQRSTSHLQPRRVKSSRSKGHPDRVGTDHRHLFDGPDGIQPDQRNDFEDLVIDASVNRSGLYRPDQAMSRIVVRVISSPRPCSRNNPLTRNTVNGSIVNGNIVVAFVCDGGDRSSIICPHNRQRKKLLSLYCSSRIHRRLARPRASERKFSPGFSMTSRCHREIRSSRSDLDYDDNDTLFFSKSSVAVVIVETMRYGAKVAWRRSNSDHNGLLVIAQPHRAVAAISCNMRLQVLDVFARPRRCPDGRMHLESCA